MPQTVLIIFFFFDYDSESGFVSQVSQSADTFADTSVSGSSDSAAGVSDVISAISVVISASPDDG